MSRDLEPGGVRVLRDRDPLERPGTHGRADELPDPERYRHTISARGTLLCTPAPVYGVSDRRASFQNACSMLERAGPRADLRGAFLPPPCTRAQMRTTPCCVQQPLIESRLRLAEVPA